MSIVSEHSLSTEPKCLWKPSCPEQTEMEKFRSLMQKKYTSAKLGKPNQKSILDHPSYVLSFDRQLSRALELVGSEPRRLLERSVGLYQDCPYYQG